MEKPQTELELFSPILIFDYIRLMTAAHYIKNKESKIPAKFKINNDNYAKIQTAPLQTPLIGLTLEYEPKSEILTVAADECFTHLYDNKIMHEVAMQYEENYGRRYAQYIITAEEN